MDDNDIPELKSPPKADVETRNGTTEANVTSAASRGGPDIETSVSYTDRGDIVDSVAALKERIAELQCCNAGLRAEVAERNAVVQALRRAKFRYKDIFDNSVQGIFQWIPDGRLLTANMAFARMMGFSTVKDLLANAAVEAFHFCLSPVVEDELTSLLERKGDVQNFELQIVRRDCTCAWANINARRVAGPGGSTDYYEAFIENITDRKSSEDKLVYQAFHDSLTGLANRALFQDRLRMALRRAARQPSYRFGVLYLDLDRFKIVNDSLGHETGDDVLCYVAACLLSCVREVDTVARFGGDEFAVLVEEMDRSSLAVTIARRIHTALTQPFVVRGQEINIGASIGIVVTACRYDVYEDILRDADTAMYRAKSDPGAFFKVFSRKMREETIENIAFENDLRQGIKTENFFLEYQPIVHIDTGKLYGFEALLLWNRNGILVSPGHFIPVAEETGLIKTLGLYMLERVCRQVVQWSKESSFPFVVHLNISGRQLIFPSFPREIQHILESTGVDPTCLLFEISESVLLNNSGACIQKIKQISEFGIRFCLDNFGTGLSSLSYLRQLPLSCIKVDRSFITDIETDSHALAIVRSLVNFGEEVGLEVIVEGIERKEQAEMLLDAGYSLAQGLYFHNALSAEKTAELLCAMHKGRL